MKERYLIFTAPGRRTHLCVVLATGKADALRIARQTFKLGRKAYAVTEGRLEQVWGMNA